MNQLKRHIKNVLVEENQNKKVNLVKQMIYDLFDEVSFIEQSTYEDKPLLKIYFDSDDPAANIESWFDEHISNEIMQLTGDNLVLLPYWTFNWDPRKKNVDIYIDTEKLKYDNLDNVINESDHKKKLKTPIGYFYKNFLNEEPIEFKGIIFQPIYHEEHDSITWRVENPEDYSFNGELIRELALNEFRDFCSLVSLDYHGLYKKINTIEEMPNGWYYLNKDDRNFIETTLKNKKYIEFDADESHFMLNFKYKSFRIHIYYDTIEIDTLGYFKGVKIDSDTGEEKELNHNFIQEMSDYEYDEFREWLYDGFYFEVLNRLRSNPRFYDPRIDMFDLSLQSLKFND